MAEKILAIQGNSFKNLNIITDTTYLLALEAQRRNYKIYWYETKDINFINSKLIAQICHIKFLENKDTFTEDEWSNLYKISEKTFVEETDELKRKGAGAGLTDND